MCMAEMTVTAAVAAVATSVRLVGEVRGAGSRRIDSDWCGGKAEELRKKKVETQPGDVVRMRDDQPVLGRSHEKREESVRAALQHTTVTRVPR